MATEQWSLLEIVQRVCRKMGLPRPISLSTVERSTDRTFDDVIDTVDEVVSNLIIRMWPEEVIKDSIILTEAPRTLTTLNVTNGSTAVSHSTSIFNSGDDGATGIPARKFITNTYDFPYTIATYTSGLVIALSSAYGGATINDSTGEGHIFQDLYPLPDDFSRPVTDLSKFINNGEVSFVSPEVLESRRRSRGSRYFIGTPDIATIVTDATGLRFLCVDPIPDAIYPLMMKYFRILTPMGKPLRAGTTTAAALYTPIPADKQSIIIDATIREFYAYQNQDPRFQTADMDMREKLLLMNSQDNTRGMIRFMPTKSKGSRRLHGSGRSIQQLANKYDLKDWWDKH